jgi:tRNA G37 N-methylase Trm5
LVVLAAGVVTSIVRRNDTTNELMAAYQAALQELADRIGAVEGFTGANGVTRNGNVFELGGELTKHTIIEPNGYEFMFAGQAVMNGLVVANKDKTKYFQLSFDQNDDLVWDAVVPPVVGIHDAAHNGAHV